MAEPDIAERLARRTLELVDIPSVSRDEGAIMAHVLAGLTLVEHADDDVIFCSENVGDAPLVVLAGHVDTVPAQDNMPGRIEDGSVVGLGASDMKGGIAVMLELERWAAQRVGQELDVGLGFLFFTREELAAEESPIPEFLATSERVRRAALVIVLEPTDNQIHAGCLGNLNVRITFHGTSAHSARPWTGENAIHTAIKELAPLAAGKPNDVVVDGLTFREVASIVGIEGGIASNVIPDRATCTVNYRYAPTRTAAEAEEHVRSLAKDLDLEIVSNSPSAPVVSDRPLVRRLRAAGELEVAPKQAWTPVAQFAEAGLDAVNFGPGATRYAHRRDERIEIAELVRTFTALQRFTAASV